MTHVSQPIQEIWNPQETLLERFPPEPTPASPTKAPPTGLLGGRLAGPGGLYNLGNALALGAGLAVQASAVETDRPGALLEAVRLYFVGSPGATALTAAILVFFVSGEAYCRAWRGGFPPDQRLNRWGDVLSGIGAVILTAALAAFGDLLLAALSGALLAFGKFGSAFRPEDSRRPDPWPFRFRLAVLASRFPALAALAAQVLTLLQTGAGPRALIMPAVMFGCYLIWARADLLLFAQRPAPRAA